MLREAVLRRVPRDSELPGHARERPVLLVEQQQKLALLPGTLVLDSRQGRLEVRQNGVYMILADLAFADVGDQQLEAMLQLGCVSVPGMGLEASHRGILDALDATAHSLANAAQKRLDQAVQVCQSLPKRRKNYGEAREPSAVLPLEASVLREKREILAA